MMHDPKYFPLTIEVAHVSRERVVVAVDMDADASPERYVVTSHPEGMTDNDVKTAINETVLNETGVVEIDEDGPYCDTVRGRMRLEEVVMGAYVPDSSEWRTLEVLGHGPGTVTLALPGGPGVFDVSGDGQTPFGAMNAAVAAAFPVGSAMTFRQSHSGRIGIMMHPDPLVDRMTMAVLASHGVTAAHVRAVIGPKATVLGATSDPERIVMVDGRPVRSDLRTSADNGVVELSCQDGVIRCNAARGRVQHLTDCLAVMDATIPETVALSLVGRPVSAMANLPFDHHDPRMTRVKPWPDGVAIDYEPHLVPLSQVEAEQAVEAAIGRLETAG